MRNTLMSSATYHALSPVYAPADKPDAQATLKAKLAAKVSAKALSKPDWYEGKNDYAWTNLDDTDKQEILNNPDNPLYIAMSNNDDDAVAAALAETQQQDADDDAAEQESEDDGALITDLNIKEIEDQVANGEIKLADYRAKLPDGVNLSDADLIVAIAMTDDDDDNAFRTNAQSVFDDKSADLVKDDEAKEAINKDVEKLSKRVSKEALKVVADGLENVEQARLATFRLIPMIQKDFGKDGLAVVGNRASMPVVGSHKSKVGKGEPFDIWSEPAPTKTNPNQTKERSVVKEIWSRTFGKSAIDLVTKLREQKETKQHPDGDTVANQHIRTMESRRDRSFEYFRDALAYVQRSFYINTFEHVQIVEGDDTAKRGTEPLRLCEKKIGGAQISMSIGTFLKYGTRLNSKGELHRPLTPTMKWAEFLETMPPRKPRTPKSGQGDTGNGDVKEISTVDQWDKYIAANATACGNKDYVAALLTRMHVKDQDGNLANEDLILSMFKVKNVFNRLLSHADFVTLYQQTNKEHLDAETKAASIPSSLQRRRAN